MSSGATTTTPREIEAKAAAEAALNGQLPLVESYLLQFSSGQYRLTAPPLFAENTQFGKGSVTGAYVDLRRGMIVYDFQTGDEYTRPETEVDHGDE